MQGELKQLCNKNIYNLNLCKTKFFLTSVYPINIIKKNRGYIMTKADLVEKIFDKIGLSKKEAQEIIEILFDTMKQTFVEGESVKISGFGTFNVRQKMARRGRNPKTGNDLEITPRRVITFRASNQLKALMEKLNE
jgi:integration host factor subunit alpha